MKGYTFFTRLLGAWSILNGLSFLLDIGFIYDSGFYLRSSREFSSIFDIFYLTEVFTAKTTWYYLCFGRILSGGLLMLFPKCLLFKLLNYFFFDNLTMGARTILSGAVVYERILLIHHFFMGYKKHPLARYLSYYSKISLRFQCSLVYLVAGLSKASGIVWKNGTALYYILNIERYNFSVINNFLINYDWLLVVGTYLVVGFQLSFFPLLHSKARPKVLIFGVFFHIATGILMGLWSFLIFPLSYLFILSEKEVEGYLRYHYYIKGKICSIFQGSLTENGTQK